MCSWSSHISKRDMCSAGGYWLTKSVSNSKELLMPIPQIDRWQKALNKKLLETIPDSERALIVCTLEYWRWQTRF